MDSTSSIHLFFCGLHTDMISLLFLFYPERENPAELSVLAQRVLCGVGTGTCAVCHAMKGLPSELCLLYPVLILDLCAVLVIGDHFVDANLAHPFFRVCLTSGVLFFFPFAQPFFTLPRCRFLYLSH